MTLRMPAIYFALASCWLCGAAASDAAQTYGFHHDYVLGTSLDLIVTTGSAKEAEAVEQSVLKTIERLRGVLSTYDPSSQISRLNHRHQYF